MRRMYNFSDLNDENPIEDYENPIEDSCKSFEYIDEIISKTEKFRSVFRSRHKGLKAILGDY